MATSASAPKKMKILIHGTCTKSIVITLAQPIGHGDVLRLAAEDQPNALDEDQGYAPCREERVQWSVVQVSYEGRVRPARR